MRSNNRRNFPLFVSETSKKESENEVGWKKRGWGSHPLERGGFE
jgi:hypothetical protein